MSGLLGFYFISWIVSGVVHNTKFQAGAGLVTRILVLVTYITMQIYDQPFFL